ncbi:hypothetical protein FBEOM_8942 [Fusarium beomiforme]|uniref:Uncharacterized protein n=1 Tax=Fusarium beomiforme TaxID=44412 RepID=A0A9P5AE62_9HYPO|nr:hypothetical protein FBEOM_8942 [Fusarium beomiforme]
MSRASEISAIDRARHKNIIPYATSDNPSTCSVEVQNVHVKGGIGMRRLADSETQGAGGKETKFLLNGKQVSSKKLEKVLRRYTGPWDFDPEDQRMKPSEDITTLVVHNPKEDSGNMWLATPWFVFWNRALETGSLSMVRRSLDKALKVAIGIADAPMVDFLLKSGTNPNGPPSYYQGPLK